MSLLKRVRNYMLSRSDTFNFYKKNYELLNSENKNNIEKIKNFEEGIELKNQEINNLINENKILTAELSKVLAKTEKIEIYNKELLFLQKESNKYVKKEFDLLTELNKELSNLHINSIENSSSIHNILIENQRILNEFHVKIQDYIQNYEVTNNSSNPLEKIFKEYYQQSEENYKILEKYIYQNTLTLEKIKDERIQYYENEVKNIKSTVDEE